MIGFLPKIGRYLFSLTTIILYERSIRDMASLHVRSARGLPCRELLPQDRPAFESLLAVQRMQESFFQPVFGIEDVDGRLIRGERCFVCEDAGRMAGYMWFSALETYVAEIDATPRLIDGDVYVYNVYVGQEYRGRNIAPSILAAASRVFLREGFGRFLLLTMSWNENMRRTLDKAKFLRVGSVSAGYLATFRFSINTCGKFSISNHSGPFAFYRKLFRKAAAALSIVVAATRGRMV